jgi:hypothetical protein
MTWPPGTTLISNRRKSRRRPLLSGATLVGTRKPQLQGVRGSNLKYFLGADPAWSVVRTLEARGEEHNF